MNPLKYVLYAVILWVSCYSGLSWSEETLQIGAARTAINPPTGVYMGGYDYNRKVSGKHDDLYASAVVFDDGKTAVALVVLDALSIQYFTTADIRSAAEKAVGNARLPGERILVQATHTHAAPDMTGLYGPSQTESGLSPEYLKQVTEASAAVVKKAWTTRRPAHIAAAAATCSGWVSNDSEAGKVDPSVTILVCTDEKGVVMATLTNFAAHPTVLDGDNTLTSADWVWGFYSEMGKKLPGIHLYLQGSIGAWIQPDTPNHSFELLEGYGRDLADKSLAAIKEAKAIPGNTIRFNRKCFEMPLANPQFKAMTELKLTPRNMDGDHVATEVAWFSVGEAQFATHPGETAPVYTEQTRALMKSGPKFILGLGLDHLGYICPEDYFDHTDKYRFADYLISMSPSREAGASMMAALGAIIP